jgi:hypothetical protein
MCSSQPRQSVIQSALHSVRTCMQQLSQSGQWTTVCLTDQPIILLIPRSIHHSPFHLPSPISHLPFTLHHLVHPSNKNAIPCPRSPIHTHPIPLSRPQTLSLTSRASKKSPSPNFPQPPIAFLALPRSQVPRNPRSPSPLKKGRKSFLLQIYNLEALSPSCVRREIFLGSKKPYRGAGGQGYISREEGQPREPRAYFLLRGKDQIDQ